MRKLEIWEVKVKIHGHTVKCGQSQDSSEDSLTPEACSQNKVGGKGNEIWFTLIPYFLL